MASMALWAMQAAWLVAAAAAARAVTRAGRLLRHPQMELTAQRAGSSSVTGVDYVKNYGNAQFLLEVEVGAQRFWVVPDTGSFALIVTSRQCEEGVCPRRFFDGSQSSTYQSLGKETKQVFGSGKLWSMGARDELSLGPYGPRTQTFREITGMDGSMTDLWETVDFDGILGLSWMTRVPGGNHSTTLNETTVTENFGISSFALCFGRKNYDWVSSSWTESPSRFYWGRPQALGSPKYTWLDVVGKHHWAVPLSKVSVKPQNDKSYPAACWDKPCAALIDSGTGVFSAPGLQLHKLTQMVGPVMGNCLNLENLPTIEFRLGGDGDDGIDVVLNPSNYVEHITLPALPGSDSSRHREMCSLMFVQHDIQTSYGPAWVLGVPFFQEFLLEYDRARSPPRIGIVKRSGDCPGEPDRVDRGPAQLDRLAGAVAMSRIEAEEVEQVGTGRRPPDARALLGGFGDADSDSGGSWVSL